MDERLVAWARAVKSRQQKKSTQGRAAGGRAVLWLFTDASRLADPLAAAGRLPRGLGGVVLRDDAMAGRVALGQALARLCRARKLQLSVAGDWRLAAALGAGLHLRSGRRPAGAPRWLKAATSSAHDMAQLRRGLRLGALAFLSPAFPTASHPDVAALGACRWGRLARRGGAVGGVAALGGIDARTVRRLPFCAAVGAIAALA